MRRTAIRFKILLNELNPHHSDSDDFLYNIKSNGDCRTISKRSAVPLALLDRVVLSYFTSSFITVMCLETLIAEDSRILSIIVVDFNASVRQEGQTSLPSCVPAREGCKELSLSVTCADRSYSVFIVTKSKIRIRYFLRDVVTYQSS